MKITVLDSTIDTQEIQEITGIQLSDNGSSLDFQIWFKNKQVKNVGIRTNCFISSLINLDNSIFKYFNNANEVKISKRYNDAFHKILATRIQLLEAWSGLRINAIPEIKI